VKAAGEEAGAEAASSPFPIVGVGASAGGLEAFTQMLGALPVDTGMAFVLVQHLSPTHASQLAAILSRSTAMPVAEVRDGTRAEPDRVYVIPPDCDMVISRGCLQLIPREKARGQHRPIDRFLRSLAEDQRDLAIGVILSGTATDGTLGLEEIKAEGGITFAQDGTAQQGSMPGSAIASGCVDFVLSPVQIALEIGRIALHPHVARAARSKRAAPAGEPDLGKVLEILRKVTGVDFTHYKASTLGRRVNRRMVLHRLEKMQDYVRFLRKNPKEVEALYQDILIPVTRFFRNPETLEGLKTTVLPKLLKDGSRREPLRVWVLGCSTGEEAYSLAILFAEFAEAKGSRLPVQIFATDLNGAGIQKARAGVYSQSIAQDVSPERLRRFFAEVDGSYRISKTIRDMCVFARHNVLTDPPFSQIDLISCRNMLIYLEPALQQKIMPLLHYALKPAGFLLLGSSETIGSQRDLFEVADAGHKSYAKKASTRRVAFGPAAGFPQARGKPGAGPERLPPAGTDLQKEADRILLARYVPPSVLVNAELEILQFRGDTGPFLAPAPGKASLNLLRMARPGLAAALRAAINKVRKEGSPVRDEEWLVNSGGATREGHLEVIPVKASPAGEAGFLILFAEPVPTSLPPGNPRGKRGRGKTLDLQDKATAKEEAAQGENARLAHELATTRDYLQAVIEQQEGANEELQSANEEAQSANEELQSLNEELETSKEEIQSSNEELATVNDELQNRNAELSLLNDTLRRAREYAESIVATVREPLLVLDAKLCVVTASQSFYRVFKQSPEETEGRFFYDLGNGPWNIPELRRLLEEVPSLDSGLDGYEVEQEFQHIGWKTMRLNARRLFQESGQGALILLAMEDVTLRKQLETAMRHRVEELAAADRSKDEFLALLAHELRNPLAPLRNAAYLLEADNAGAAAVEAARSMMSRQIQNMSRLIEDLLDVSRITRGEVRLRRERLELATVLGQAVELTRHLVEARRQELSLSMPREPVHLDADPVRLEQVFGNLLNNASKFTPVDGHLWLTAELASEEPGSPGEVVVSVRDDGIGMAPETLPQAFDLFVQAERSYDRGRGGLGIGLTVARRLIELHGGRIEARSAGLGQGSELVVRLPVLPPMSSPASAQPEGSEDAESGTTAGPAVFTTPGARRRVLVVDDNVDTAESLSLLLRLRGYEVEIAYDGPAALKRAASFHPEAILLDIGLPGLDGYQVASRLRRRRRSAKVLLVALTGYGQEEDQRRSREAGFDHHLTKPVDPRVIYDLLAHPRPAAG